jgi:CRP-like cAMP-binding protein
MIAIMSDWIEALGRLLGPERQAEAGSVLFRQGDEVRFMYVVREGCVHLVRWGESGSSAVMQRANAPAALAESSVFSSAYHCDGVCVSDCVLARAPIAAVREALESEPDLLRKLTHHLAREVQRTRARVELLSRRTVADRLDGWLALNDGKLPDRGQWHTVAGDIGVTTEAFYRELQRRRRTSRATD